VYPGRDPAARCGPGGSLGRTEATGFGNVAQAEDEVLGKLDEKMSVVFAGVLAMARKTEVYMRDAAYMVAIDRGATAMKLRGWV
jgi:glutamate dehydrogenase/leucine dehydrogenase